MEAAAPPATAAAAASVATLIYLPQARVSASSRVSAQASCPHAVECVRECVLAELISLAAQLVRHRIAHVAAAAAAQCGWRGKMKRGRGGGLWRSRSVPDDLNSARCFGAGASSQRRVVTHSEATRSDPLGRCYGSDRSVVTHRRGALPALSHREKLFGLVWCLQREKRSTLNGLQSAKQTLAKLLKMWEKKVLRRLKLMATEAASIAAALHSAARWLMEHFQDVINNSNMSSLMDGHH